eukprot:gene8959-biopygen7628
MPHFRGCAEKVRPARGDNGGTPPGRHGLTAKCMTVTAVEAGSPGLAAKVHIPVGSRIAKVAGKAVDTDRTLQSALRASAGNVVKLHLNVHPSSDCPAGCGAVDAPSTCFAKCPVYAATRYAVFGDSAQPITVLSRSRERSCVSCSARAALTRKLRTSKKTHPKRKPRRPRHPARMRTPGRRAVAAGGIAAVTTVDPTRSDPPSRPLPANRPPSPAAGRGRGKSPRAKSQPQPPARVR